MKKIILSLVVLSTVLVSCKKTDKNCDLNANNLVGTYRLTAATYKANTATAAIDLFATLSPCEKDDLLILNSGGTYTYTDAGVVCSPSGNDTGLWSFSGSTLIIDGDAYSVPSFSCSGMTITQAGTTPGELTTLTLTK